MNKEIITKILDYADGVVEVGESRTGYNKAQRLRSEVLRMADEENPVATYQGWFGEPEPTQAELWQRIKELEDKVAEKQNLEVELNEWRDAAEYIRVDPDVDFNRMRAIPEAIPKLIERRNYWRDRARSFERIVKTQAEVIANPSGVGEFVSAKTNKLCLEDITFFAGPHRLSLARRAAIASAKAIGEALGIKITWSNEYDAKENPDKSIGHFVIEKEGK